MPAACAEAAFEEANNTGYNQAATESVDRGMKRLLPTQHSLTRDAYNARYSRKAKKGSERSG
ncbi:MAG: hypothetical protein ACPGLU_08410 [Paracoccaceae bacterium]